MNLITPVRDENFMKGVRHFTISPTFLEAFKGKQPKWGPLGYVTYKRTYARNLDNGFTEEFWQTLERVVNGVFSIQKAHCKNLGIPWDDDKAQRSAKGMYQRMWVFKFLPPGRGLWIMGTEFIEKHGSAALQNCGFASTEDIDTKFTKPFEFLMDMSMLGVGVGFDTMGAGKITILQPKETTDIFAIPDSREGWVEALHFVLEGFFLGKGIPELRYHLIREEGLPIKGFGGTASGPQPLMDLIENISNLLKSRIGQLLTSVDEVDIMNFIGKCVIAGNVRRCLPKGTLIHTKKGLLKIEEVNKGDLVATSKGYFPVSENVYQGKQSLFSVQTKLGTFRCTAKHKVAVLDSFDTYVWKQAKELSIGDRLVFPDHILEGEETTLPANTYFKEPSARTGKDITVPDLDISMSWFLGLFHGDGNTYPNFENKGASAYVSVGCSPDYTSVTAQAEEQLSRFGTRVYTEATDGDLCLRVRSNSRCLAQYFSNFKTAHQSISIPEFILSAQPAIRASYLAGLFDSDGSYRDKPLLAVGTVYRSFAEEIQSLYASLGIPVRIIFKEKQEQHWQDQWNVTVVGKFALDKFLSLVAPHSRKLPDQFSVPRRSQNDYGYPREWAQKFGVKRHRPAGLNQLAHSTFVSNGNHFSGLIPIEVLAVGMSSQSEETYDLSVPEVNEFIVSQGLLVHNTAEIALGYPDDNGYITMKQDMEKLASHRWASNNSVFAKAGMDYSKIVEAIWKNGEPGLIWLENIQKYGRMSDPATWADRKVRGVNPCGEQSLESYELCNLVETFPSLHETYEDYQKTLSFAYLYAKSVTLLNTHWPETNAVMMKNRRIGLSQTGIIDAISKHGYAEMKRWCEEGYQYITKRDDIYSDWLCVPKSKKKTTVKPSGTVSLLPQVNPGIHYGHSEYYWRLIRIQKDSPIVGILREAGYKIEDAASDPTRTCCVYFPVHDKHFTKGKEDVTVWEQIGNAVMYQELWSDNQVSITVTFKENEKEDLVHALSMYEDKLKSISFLPLTGHGYEQAPYQTITKEQYEEEAAKLKPYDLSKVTAPGAGVSGCDNDSCEVPQIQPLADKELKPV